MRRDEGFRRRVGRRQLGREAPQHPFRRRQKDAAEHGAVVPAARHWHACLALGAAHDGRELVQRIADEGIVLGWGNNAWIAGSWPVGMRGQNDVSVSVMGER